MITKSQAQRRIDETSELQPYERAIMYEWPEGDEHYEWAATAPVDEIIEWAKMIEGDSAYMIKS